MKLANYLKEARIKAGLTQSDVSEALGYTTPQFVSNWERGVSQPPIDVLKKIARLYKVSDEELFEVTLEVTLESVQKDMQRRFINSSKVLAK